MAYVTYTELTNRFPLLATWNASETIVSSDLLHYAEREVEARLASHFAVPFEGSHPTVKDLVLDLAYYRTLRLKDPEKAEKLHKMVVGRIEDIKEGKELLMTGSGTAIEPAAAGLSPWSTTMDYETVHSMLDAEDAATGIDPDRIDDEESERG